MITFRANGNPVMVEDSPATRLSTVLRGTLGLEGTKIGCDAGDCGACTILIDGETACACMVPLAQVEGRNVVTIEGVASNTRSGKALQMAFLAEGAAQCGMCTPGMVMSAAGLLDSNPTADEAAIEQALGGVLCRCTGYRKIISAVAAAAMGEPQGESVPVSGHCVGTPMPRVDGEPKVAGTERFGADGIPADALHLRIVRAPYHHAIFTFGDLATFVRENAGVVRVLTASDVPGRNLYGVLPLFADQPVFAAHETRHRGEAVAAIVGEAQAVAALDLSKFPITWQEQPALLTIDQATHAEAPLLHAQRAGNVLVRGFVAKGDVQSAMANCAAVVRGTFETGFVEHAYLEPEAGWAIRRGDRLEMTACTQAPYLDRDDTALILGIPPENVRVIPSACGGGFGSKLDLSVQPFIAVAAWLTGRPCALVYSRPESIATTTKRHPSRITATVGATRDGRLLAMEVEGDFNTGAYASWGPTVANRVPVHASGPYFIPNYRARSRAIHTHAVPAGAFRGFGVPQAAIAQEQLFDEIALKLGIDPLEFRITNALTADQPTVTNQIMGDGVGYRQCLVALRSQWAKARAEAEAFNAANTRLRRGVGVAGMFYGCGNTSLANPSTIRIGITPNGRVSLHQGAVDIGQGANTVIMQIAADALGLPSALFDLVSPDTDLTPDCGKTSASRQTFVTGKAAEKAGRALREEILRLVNAGPDARISIAHGNIVVVHPGVMHAVSLSSLKPDEHGYVLAAEETFDPPTTPLDANGQGNPYAVYGFGAHLAEIEVDTHLGTVRVRRVTAAHDVGRAINPLLVEGQIEGGVAQGIGLALMEEFTPGRGENLHDYLIPTIGDVPEIKSILIEDPSSVGPYGAKGIGEQALIPTAPAIYNAIHHATGVRVTRAPATPDRLRAAIRAKEASS